MAKRRVLTSQAATGPVTSEGCCAHKRTARPKHYYYRCVQWLLVLPCFCALN